MLSFADFHSWRRSSSEKSTKTSPRERLLAEGKRMETRVVASNLRLVMSRLLALCVEQGKALPNCWEFAFGTIDIFPRDINPLSPPSDPVQRRLQSPSAKSNFLAVKTDHDSGFQCHDCLRSRHPYRPGPLQPKQASLFGGAQRPTRSRSLRMTRTPALALLILRDRDYRRSC